MLNPLDVINYICLGFMTIAFSIFFTGNTSAHYYSLTVQDFFIEFPEFFLEN
jgi:hypothetical protein